MISGGVPECFKKRLRQPGFCRSEAFVFSHFSWHRPQLTREAERGFRGFFDHFWNGNRFNTNSHENPAGQTNEGLMFDSQKNFIK